jgi:hypothetical protein
MTAGTAVTAWSEIFAPFGGYSVYEIPLERIFMVYSKSYTTVFFTSGFTHCAMNFRCCGCC